MSRRFVVSLALGCSLVAAAVVSPVTAPARSKPSWLKSKPSLTKVAPDYVPGELVVQYKRGVSHATARGVAGRAGALTSRRLTSYGTELLKVPTGSESATLARLQRSPLVRHVERNALRYPFLVPNDTDFTDQWGLDNTGQSHKVAAWPGSSTTTASGTSDADIDAPEAWDVQTGSPETVIAVLDSGTDVTHADLAPNIWVNPGETAGDGIDNDANGFVDDVNGWDFGDNDNSLHEPNTGVFGYEHGTHVAGIAAAAFNDSTGVAGVCPNCNIMVLKVGSVFSDPGGPVIGIELSAIIDALDYASANDADIVNASFGAPFLWSKSERAAFKRAGNAGILSVVAAGNSNGDNDHFLQFDFDGDQLLDVMSPNYPASYALSSILAVAASNHHDEYAYTTGCALLEGSRDWPCAFTNWGHESVDVIAPGVDELSSIPGNSYDTFDGTSFSSPTVAGVAGLVKSQHPEYTPSQIKNAIINSADVRSTFNQLFAFPQTPASGQFTLRNARVNAFAALTGSTTALPTTDGNVGGAKSIRSKKTGSVRWPADVNDVYKKKLVQGARYSVILDGPSGEDFDLWIWKPKSKEIWQLEEGCFGGAGACKLFALSIQPGTADEGGKIKATQTGVYYFQVNAYLFSGGNYTFKIKRL